MRFIISKTMILGVLFLSAILTAGRVGPLGIFINFETLTVLVVVIAAAIVAAGEFKTFTAAVNALLSKKYVLNAQMQDKAIRLFKLLIKVTICATVLFVTMAVMLLMLTMMEPDMLGPWIAVMLVLVFYGAFLCLIFIISIGALENRRNAEEKIVISEKQVIEKLLELCHKQGITPEEIIDAEEISFRKGGN